MVALLYETVPAFATTWMECLGDLGRYRMAIEDDDNDSEMDGKRKETQEDYRTRTIPDPNDNYNVKALKQARYLAEGTCRKVFARFADPNILPYLYTILVFHRYLILYPSAMSQLEATFPWEMVLVLLNTLLPSCREYERIQSYEFPRPDKQSPKPLLEDFAFRGLLWADKYFPSDWFSNDKIDDDEKHLEVASMTDERKERILWLGVSIARHDKWLLYDEDFHRFSVPSRFE
ncbi:hypothetical protein PG988_015087 [Apiospora saccharicola]